MPAFEPLSELLPQALPEAHVWSGRPSAADVAPLPAAPALLLFVGEAGEPVQLLTTQNLRRFVLARLSAPEEAVRGRADLADVVRGARWRVVTCPFEARWWYYRLASALHPRDYREMIGFGPAWFLHVNWQAAIPELQVTDQVWVQPGEFVGPWPTHKSCQQALEGLWDLFDLCRYPEQVRRSPLGTRCSYAEMGRCDAPCDGSAPLEPYVARLRAAWDFACGGSAAWSETAETRMHAAAQTRAFERAALIKKQIAFARHWQAEWTSHARHMSEMTFLIALPVTRRRAWKLFVFRSGAIVDGPILPDRSAKTGLAAWLATAAGVPDPDVVPRVRMEQTWLLSHLLFGREAEDGVILRTTGFAGDDLVERCISEMRARRGKVGAEQAEHGPEVRAGEQ